MHRSGHIPTHTYQSRHLTKSCYKDLHIHKHQHIQKCMLVNGCVYVYTSIYTLHIPATYMHKPIHVSEHTCLSKQGLDLEVGLCPQFQSSAE